MTVLPRAGRPAIVTILPALVAAVLGGWRLGVPSLWRDESVSALAARMSLADLRRLLADIDTVHALYYVLLRPFAALGGPPEVPFRLLSVVAFTAAAFGVAALGQRLAGPVAGLSGGLFYALTPIADRYAQEARSYALVSAVAVLSTWLLVRLVDRPTPWLHVGYAASLALLGWLHLYAVLLVPAHLVAAWLAGRRSALLSAAGAGVALLPLVAIAAGQRDAQVFWLHAPGLKEVAAFPVEVAGSWPAAALLFGLALWGTWRVPVVTLWAVVPVVLSMAISQVQPIYHPRYVLFAVPGLALLAGIGAEALLRRWWPAVTVPVAVLAFAVLTYGTQVALREPNARPDDLRSLAAALAAEERPGDRVLFVPQRYRLFVAVYGEPYERLVDLTRAPGAAEPRTAAELGQALAGAERVWLVSPRIGPRYADDERYLALKKRLKPGRTRTFGSIHLTLYTRVN
ncbi:glycosyltransferase family 39 protein [Nonomuraea sp. NPDC000554]|uniref:glycosyltransferase family 39 protein n=1 Tax=Nonomuraea sp. NPDC000554 TaxID=3154259 RepID=UPI00331DFD37